MGKVYQISSISYCLGWGTVPGEVDTKDSHGVLLPRTPLPALGAPPPPRVPSLLWQIGAHPRG